MLTGHHDGQLRPKIYLLTKETGREDSGENQNSIAWK